MKKISFLAPLALASPLYGVDWSPTVGSDFNNNDNWTGTISGAAAEFNSDATTQLSGDITVTAVELTTGTGATNTLSIGTAGNTLSLGGLNTKGTGTGNIDISGGGLLRLTGSSTFRTASKSTIDYNGVDIEGTSVAQKLTLAIDAGTGGQSLTGVEVSGIGELIVNQGNLTINGDNTVNAKVTLRSGGALLFDSLSDSLTITSSSPFEGDSNGASWVFDLDSNYGFQSGTPYIDAQSIDLTNVSLDLSNIESTVDSRRPVFLASYTSLNGEFSTINGLWPPNKRIDYNWNGTGMIAVVPEPSLFLPVLAGFVPLLGFRRRSRR